MAHYFTPPAFLVAIETIQPFVSRMLERLLE